MNIHRENAIQTSLVVSIATQNGSVVEFIAELEFLSVPL